MHGRRGIRQLTLPRAAGLLAGLLALVVPGAVAIAPVTPARAAADACAAGTDPIELSAFFSSGASGLVGADYPHAYPLPDGRTLWMFQDSFLGTADTPRLDQAGFAHNAALVQTGLCFDLLWGGGPREAPQSFLGGDLETDLTHWWWPLDGEMGADGRLHVFAAEFRNDAGTGAAPGATPVAVWQAVIDPVTLAVEAFAPAPDPGDRPLYGFSIASDDQWSYLYGNCDRQFTADEFVGWFDITCNTEVRVARVPKGVFDAPPEYWDGVGWVSDRNAAVVVHDDGSLADPLQVDRLPDGRFVAVSHLDDWFGSSVMAYSATSPTGPFTRYAQVPVATQCGSPCTTYFASFLPWRTASGSFEVAISNFTWDFDLAIAQPWLYRPSVVSVPSPDEPVDPQPFTIGPDGTVALKVTGRNGVDPSAASVTFTLVATGVVSPGFVTAWPCGTRRPVASNLNLLPFSTVGNLVVSSIGAGGRVCLWSSVRAELIADVQGWSASGSDYHRVLPARLLDTRPGFPTADGQMAGSGVLQPGVLLQVPVTGRGGIAAFSRQVALNVTAAGATAPGYVLVWDCGTPPTTSNLNVMVGQAVSNLTVVGVGATGAVCVMASTATHVLIDVQGWWGGRGELVTGQPARLFDSRPGAVTADGLGRPGRRIRGGEVVYLPVAGRAGLGAGEAVVLNVVVTRADRAGYLTVWPCDTPQPVTSNVNFQAGSARATLTITDAAYDGSVCFALGGADRADVVVDATGWFPVADGGYVPVAPSRALDTRAR